MTTMQATVSENDAALIEKLKDSKYFRESFFWIVDRDEQKVPFRQNPAQADYYANQTENDLILKARHLGFSSEIEGDFVFDCMTIPNTNALTMAHTMDDTHIHMKRVQYYLDTMGSRDCRVEVTLETENVKELYFPEMNSFYWIGTAGAKGFGRGRQLTRVHGSEVAHWPDQTVLTAVLNARSRRAKTRLETTACGVGEKFYELWYEAEDPHSNSPYKQHFFAWWMDPGNVVPVPQDRRFTPTGDEVRVRDIVFKMYRVRLADEQLSWWRVERSRQPDKTLMAQEHPSYPREAFISSGRHVFSIPKLEIMQKRAKTPLCVGELVDDEKEISFADNPDGPLTIWITPREGRKYFIPADIAEGLVDGCYSVAPVLDRSSWEVVAELRLRCDPGDFGRMLCILGEYYHWALLAPEMNNHGNATLEAIKAKEYPHVLKTTDLWPDSTEKLGWPTDDRTKEAAISAYRNAIDDLAFIDNSKVAISEAMGAVRDEHGKMVSERAKSKTGIDKKKLYLDCVITRMIGLYCLKFLTLDETFRDKGDQDAPMVTTSVVRRRSGRRG